MITLLQTTFTMKGSMAELQVLEKLLGKFPTARIDTTIKACEFTPAEWKLLNEMYMVLSSYSSGFLPTPTPEAGRDE